ncbi:MAG: type II toxin-antitoxin system RelE/ParE family toxin [Flavobacteriales bacterium]|nr:type II toxin-antitoxin system RelE/ParE family toxin [Flavobacteriales bacterium]MCB0811126.1 type II toxin-antitoxin system RelE/ParE family toxin [Flavobacteriales bacterium]MCB9179813.1 type II toxin-antitoxin system RelE/ParE family toxin [Flavobacteriales bacterium]
MKVIWSAWALHQLDEIHARCSTGSSPKVADRLVDDLLAAAQLLEQLPFGGQVEPWLAHKNLGHRRVVVGNYKVVYRVFEEEVRIVDVFDSRQDPDKMTV